MKTAIITGAGGFVGSYVVLEFLNAGWNVIALVHCAARVSDVGKDERFRRVNYLAAIDEAVAGQSITVIDSERSSFAVEKRRHEGVAKGRRERGPFFQWRRLDKSLNKCAYWVYGNSMS